MAYMLSVYLSANTCEMTPNILHVYVSDAPGAGVKQYDIPLPQIGHTIDQADDEWIRDLLVAAVEVL